MEEEQYLTEKLKGFEIKFYTKSGVFSKKGLDHGTRLLIDCMKIDDGTLVADLGCGTGMLGFTAAKLNPKGHVHSLDVNIRAIELAKRNAELNKFRNVEVYLSDQFSAVGSRTYQTILSNPAQHSGNDFLEETAQECFDHLKEGGIVYWVLQRHIKPVAEKIFQYVFGNFEIVDHNKDFIVISAKRKKK